MGLRIAVIGAKGLPSRSGVERVVEALVANLGKRHQVTLYCDARYTPPGYSRDDIDVVRVPTLTGKHAQATSLFVQSAIRAVVGGKYDVLHVHSVETGFFLPLLRSRYPLVATAHGSPVRSTRAKWGPLARRMMAATERPFVCVPDVVTSVSAVDAQYFSSRYGRDVAYIPNGMEPVQDIPEAIAREVCARHGLTPGDYLLFAAGRIDPTKGCHVFLQALSLVRGQHHAVVLGDLQQVPEYAEELRRIGAGLDVRFLSPIANRQELFAVVSACRAFIFPSLTEGMSMMLLEAAAASVPLLCSDIPENRCILGDRALYFRSGNPADLARRLAWGMGHPGEMKRISSAARDWVHTKYSWERIIPMYESAYELAIRRREERRDSFL